MVAADVLTTEEVARLVHLSTGTVRRWRTERYGPPWHRIGRRAVFYDRADVEAWIQAQRRHGIPTIT